MQNCSISIANALEILQSCTKPSILQWDLTAMDLTHWGWVTHICVSKETIIGSDNGLSPGRRQAIIWTNAGILLIGPLGTNFNEISIKIHTFSFKEMRLKMSSGKWRPFCLSLNVLTLWGLLWAWGLPKMKSAWHVLICIRRLPDPGRRVCWYSTGG